MHTDDSQSHIVDSVEAVESAYSEFKEALHVLEEEQQDVIETVRDEITQKKINEIKKDILNS